MANSVCQGCRWTNGKLHGLFNQGLHFCRVPHIWLATSTSHGSAGRDNDVVLLARQSHKQQDACFSESKSFYSTWAKHLAIFDFLHRSSWGLFYFLFSMKIAGFWRKNFQDDSKLVEGLWLSHFCIFKETTPGDAETGRTFKRFMGRLSKFVSQRLLWEWSMANMSEKQAQLNQILGTICTKQVRAVQSFLFFITDIFQSPAWGCGDSVCMSGHGAVLMGLWMWFLSEPNPLIHDGGLWTFVLAVALTQQHFPSLWLSLLCVTTAVLGAVWWKRSGHRAK